VQIALNLSGRLETEQASLDLLSVRYTKRNNVTVRYRLLPREMVFAIHCSSYIRFGSEQDCLFLQ
jgi:hypothetical protein